MTNISIRLGLDDDEALAAALEVADATPSVTAEVESIPGGEAGALVEPVTVMLIGAGVLADAVGLGKTLEAGIMVSELIRRGRGKRILVLAVKSMLTQFQKEFWSRFAIPLTRLDSAGLQRVRNRIPTNHNPFHYFDKTIISIDTLKQDIEYRHHLENAWWDIIVIDEAHNVAERGTSSLRSKLAKLLAGRSDTLIMLSATPHDGKPESFASLMNMLDPTAIANPQEYEYSDFADKNLVVRRFKKDVKDQMVGEFPERQISALKRKASAAEEEVYRRLVESKLRDDDDDDTPATKGRLFKVTLEKALFSSPMACASVVANRLKRLESRKEINSQSQINELQSLLAALNNVDASQFSKYQLLLETIRADLQWKANKSDDRLVIFTESIKTLEFLAENLARDLKLKPEQLATLRGDQGDVELMDTVGLDIAVADMVQHQRVHHRVRLVQAVVRVGQTVLRGFADQGAHQQTVDQLFETRGSLIAPPKVSVGLPRMNLGRK